MGIVRLSRMQQQRPPRPAIKVEGTGLNKLSQAPVTGLPEVAAALLDQEGPVNSASGLTVARLVAVYWNLLYNYTKVLIVPEVR